MTFRGHIENGVIVLDSPCPLPEGTKVSVTAEEHPLHQPSAAGSLLHLVAEIEATVPPEAWESLPRDGAQNVDHYLYGAPKQTG